MKNPRTIFPLKTLAAAALLLAPLTPAQADEGNQPPLPSMECVDVVGTAKLGPDPTCAIAGSHHRYDQFPEDSEEGDESFLWDVLGAEACQDPTQPCCVKGLFQGTMGDYPFVAQAACGFTVNALMTDANEVNADLAGIGYQQFTARTILRVFYGTSTLPAPNSENDPNKPDFGLFFGDAGVVDANFYVSQRMSLTGSKKLPRGTKMKLDMWGAPPVRTISGKICGPKLKQTLEAIAETREHGSDD